MSKSKIRYLVPRDGVLYIKVPIGHYANGQVRHKEKRVYSEYEAIQEIARIQKEYGEVSSGALNADRITFNTLLAEYKKVYPKKHECYLRPLRQFFADRRIKTITHADCLRYKASREKVRNGKYKDQAKAPARNPTTVNRELEVLRSILYFACDNDWLSKNPFRRIRGQRPLIDKKLEKSRKRFPSPAEEVRLLAVCVPPRLHLRGLVLASLDTGLRRGALQELVWANIDFHSRLIKVPEGNKYKDRPPYTGMTERLEAELLRLYRESDKKADSKVFGTIKEFKGSWETACKLAGIEGLRFNDLRHGFSTGLMEAGIPKHLAMRAAGHKNPDVHDIYANIDERIARQVADALDKLHQSRLGSKFGSKSVPTLVSSRKIK